MTLSPKISILPQSLEEYIDDIDINYKTPKDNFLGTFIGRILTLQLSQLNGEIPKEVTIEIEIDGNSKKQPAFIISQPNKDEISEEVELKGYDYSIKFDVPFDSSIIQFPCTNLELAQAICNYCGVELENVDFINNNFIITSQKVDSKNNCREIIGMIACDAAGIAFMNENNKVEIRSITETDIVIDDIFEHNFTQKIGPINSVVIAREPISDYIVLKDDESISNNGLTEMKITNNVLIDDNREEAIIPIFNKLNGIEFICATVETYEGFKVKPFDLVKINNQKILVTNINIKYPNILDGSIGSEQLTKTESNYKIAKGIEKRLINAEAKVDKVTGEITQLAQQTTDHEEKISQIEQDVSSITQQVSEIADITRTVIENNEVHITEAMPVEPGTFKIYGHSTYFKYLYPSEELYPSDNLYPAGDYFTLCLDKQSRDNPSEEKKEFRIELEEPLRHFNDVYDEFYVSNVDSVAKVIRRVGINSDGTLYVLENETEETIGELHLLLFEGDNYIYVKEFHNLKYEIEYAILNNFTKNFATSLEVSSKISQTSSQIMQEVNKKVDEEEFGTQLTLNYEALQLAWNQISQYLKMEGINGKATLNIYDKNNNRLMSLSNTGQKFYRNDGTEIGDIGLLTDSEGKNQLVFSLNTESSRDGMAWGIKNSAGKFFPIFQMVAFDYAEQSEYGGYFQMVATLDMLSNEIKLMDTKIVGEVVGGITVYDENGNNYISLGTDNFSICNNQIKFYQNSLGSYTLNFYQNNIANVNNLEAKTISAEDVVADTIVQTSIKQKKKYVKRTDKKALELIGQADICQYQFKGEKTKGHRHYGLVIGENYNCPNEVIAQNGKGIDTYSMISIAWKAIQELKKENEQLRKELEEVKNEKN